VNPAPQSIFFAPPTTPIAYFAGETTPLMATASSGLAVAYTVTGPATLSGSTLIYTGAGTVVVTASQQGDADYTSAAPVSQTIVISIVPTAFAAPSTQVTFTSPIQTATLFFASAGTLDSINVVTKGAPNLDFNFVSGGTCATGTAYTAGQICTVLYSFTPLYPGAP